MKLDTKWTLITIDDPEFLPGISIFNVFQLVLKVMKFKFVILDYIYGAADNGLIYSLQEKKDEILEIDHFLKIVSDVIQFDWGDFFLFREYPKDWNNPKDKPYPDIINQTDTTIRAIDDQYIYIYTPYQEIVNVIKDNYDIESIKTDSLDNLDYPD